MKHLQERAEGFPVDDTVKPWQSTTPFLQLSQPILLVEKARLDAISPLSHQPPLRARESEAKARSPR
jgi:hypothetical protein